MVSFRVLAHSLLAPYTRLGPHALRAFTGRYDVFGSPVYSEGEIVIHSSSWRDAEQFGIEGIHQCSAALRTRKEVKFLQVHLDFIADWRRFGAWMKTYDYIVAVPQESN